MKLRNKAQIVSVKKTSSCYAIICTIYKHFIEFDFYIVELSTLILQPITSDVVVIIDGLRHIGSW